MVSISGSDGSLYTNLAASGTLSVQPLTTTLYTLNAIGAGGTTGPLSVVPTLFNTGVDASHVVLPDGSNDPHWTVYYPAQDTTGQAYFGPWPLQAAVTETSVNRPSTVSDARVISNIEAFGPSNGGTWIYTTTFTTTLPLMGIVANIFEADNNITSIKVNGVENLSVPIVGGFGAVSVPLTQGFQVGLNTIVVSLYNITASGPQVQDLGIEWTNTILPATATATVTVSPFATGSVTPDVTTGVPSWFMGGASIAAGTYRIRYVGGAYQFDINKGFAIEGGGSAPNMGAGPFAGFHLTDGITAAPITPGGAGLFAVPGDAANASAGDVLFYAHGGGPLGAYLSQQALGYQNAPGLGPTPTFEIYGPVPTAALSASVPAVRAGQSVLLSWNTTGGTASIDNGVGSVAASGSLLVTPPASTTYNLTCTNACNSASAAQSVTVVPPGIPASLTAQSA